MNDVEHLYREHIDGAVRLAYLLTGSRAGAEDIAQDAFMRCAGKLKSLRDPTRFARYLHQAIARAVIDEHRAVVRRGRREDRFAGSARRLQQDEQLPQQVATRVDVMTALDRLPANQRATVILRYWLDASEHDIASMLGCSTGTVKSRLARAIGTLKGVLDE